MADDRVNAGDLPAFMEYPALGGGYALLWNELRSGRRAHAYLLSGPRGVGKLTYARVLAAMLLCEAVNKPCGQCGECRNVFTGNHPDLIEVLSPDGKTISIDRIRETITAISQHSFGSGPRIVVIEPAEKLTPAAQNCLLKSLEEPPADVLFFLLAHESGAVLATIASRCLNVKLSPWPDELLLPLLLHYGYEQSHAEAALSGAGGVIGEALRMLSDETSQGELMQMIDQALSIRRDADVVAISTRLKDDRDGAERALTALEQALHQALMLRTGVMSPQARLSMQVRAWGQNTDAETLTELIRSVFDTRRKRQSQVNWQASLDHLLMKLLEAKTAWQQS